MSSEFFLRHAPMCIGISLRSRFTLIYTDYLMAMKALRHRGGGYRGIPPRADLRPQSGSGDQVIRGGGRGRLKFVNELVVFDADTQGTS